VDVQRLGPEPAAGLKFPFVGMPAWRSESAPVQHRCGLWKSPVQRRRTGLFVAEGRVDYVAPNGIGLRAEENRYAAAVSGTPVTVGLVVDRLSRKFRQAK
jgi:hypothetical protein